MFFVHETMMLANRTHPAHGIEEMGISVKKTVKQPNLNVRFSSVVTPGEEWLVISVQSSAGIFRSDNFLRILQNEFFSCAEASMLIFSV